MLKNLENTLKKVPRDAMNQWKQFNENAKRGAILDNLKAEKLKSTMARIPLRTIKDAEDRIMGQGDKVKGMIKNLENTLKKIPRDALSKWKQFNEDAKKGAILDAMRAKDLKFALDKIPLRTTKDAVERIIGQGDKIKGMLKNLENQLKKIPRDAIRQWKDFNDKAKTGAILDAARAKELKFKLEKIPLRTTKDAVERIIGQGDKVKGMLKNLENKLKKIPRDAIRQWKDFNDKAKVGAILDAAKAKELKFKL